MSAIGRAFVAVVPSPPVLDAIGEAVGSVEGSRPAGRWTTRDQWHVTLQFLGNHADLDTAAAALGPVSVPNGAAQLGDVGAFPSERRGRVVWVGFTNGAEVLTEIAGAVASALAPLGYEPESRAFHPHITLARLKPPTDARQVVAALDASNFGPSWSIDEFVLFRSFTRPTGAEYEAIARVPLVGCI